MAPVLELRGITKRFPGVLANDHIDLALEQGEILALLGENGAGKSTLMNVLYGLYKQDEGEITVRGKPVQKQDVRLDLNLLAKSPEQAVAKALGTGIWRAGICWTDIEVCKDVESGEPSLVLHDATAARSQQINIREWSVSISHDRTRAIAFVVAT